MQNRREFIKTSGALALGALFLPALAQAAKVKNPGLQLYSVRQEMTADATGTLKKLAQMGYKELESAKSEKGHYYGLSPKEIKKVCQDLGMKLRSGHVQIDKNWQRTVDEAAESGQKYLVCSSLPSSGQTVSNYQKVANTFSKAAEACKKADITFAYHNHEYEFEKKDGKVLYDILLDETDPKLVAMEMDLGWVIVTGNDPVTYFEKYPGRFPLWHLKDMKKEHAESTEFGKGQIDIARMFQNASKSGLKYYFVEQEEYANNALTSMQHNIDYLKKLRY